MTRGQHLIGKRLGTCTLQRLLGYGGTSAVFLAQEHEPERQVAVKVFLPRANQDARMQRDFYQRFLHEAESASKLHHSNILPIYSYGEEDGLPYIVMPYMSGGTLREYCVRRGRLSLQEVQWYLEQLGAALDYAHTHGCVHCDVKPANMLLDSEGHVLLSDFGIARLTQPNGTKSRLPDVVMGTPDYISPEQALGRPVDGRSDIYSLGITIFFLLAKNLPFIADDPLALALLHLHEKPPALALIRGDITPAVDRVIQKAMAKDPNERYQSGAEFSAAFSAAVETSTRRSKSHPGHEGWSVEEVTEVPPDDVPLPGLAGLPSVQVKPVRVQRRRRVSVLLAVVLCLVLVSVFVVFQLISAGQSAQQTKQKPTAVVPDLLMDSDNWPSSSTFFFEKHSYHILNTSEQNSVVAPYYDHQYRNFRFRVTMRKVHDADNGSNYYGIAFRMAADQSHYYVFEIDPSETGRFALLRYDGQNDTWDALGSGFASTLIDRENLDNTIEVEARSNTFSFKINGQKVGEVLADHNEKPLSVGQIGLYVESKGLEVIFSQCQIDSL